MTPITLALTYDVSALPNEVRLFRRGWNKTAKGDFLFDESAAETVMKAFAEQGVDVLFDLEHRSLLDPRKDVNFSTDAQAWCSLEVRNGELWAVNIRWTPEGAERLQLKKQRYISPAFWTDDENRIESITNVGLVAMPATFETPALVAASKGFATMPTEKIQARFIELKSQFQRLADAMPADGAPAPSKGKVAQIVDAMKAARTAIDDAEKALKGRDIDAIFEAMNGAAKVMADFTASLEAFNGAPAAPSPDQVEPAEAPSVEAGCAPGEQKMSRQDEQELIQLRAEKIERAARETRERQVREQAERLSLVAELVALGRETPATAWEADGTTPKPFLQTLALEVLRARVESFRSLGSLIGAGPQAPKGGTVEAGQGVQLGAFEADRVRTYAAKRRSELTSIGQGSLARSDDEVLARYASHKGQQIEWARHAAPHRLNDLGKAIEEKHVLLDRRGERMVQLAAVKPIESFGASSQRALEEFRLEYNMALAAEPQAWAEQIGSMLPSGSLKTTFPLNFDAISYTEKTAQNAPAIVAQNADITVSKREFFAGKQVELKRLNDGDFAYVQNWTSQARQMARARVLLRNALVRTLLEAGTTGYWGSSSDLATGIDGQPFFSASHKVNPFDARIQLRSSATWGNYQSSATPLNAGNLTAEKTAIYSVATADGQEIGYEFDTILVPSALAETAKNLLTMQDIILDAASSLKSVSNVMGAVKNPHFNSGLSYVRAPELAGSAVTANYYLISRAAIAAGLSPWVISEDAAEELRNWDENSDFYKNSGLIKVESHVYCNAALLWPHAIRYIKGS